MNETRRKPTTGRQSPSLFDKWHGIFYMPSRIDEAGHTKAFDFPVAEHLGDLTKEVHFGNSFIHDRIAFEMDSFNF